MTKKFLSILTLGLLGVILVSCGEISSATGSSNTTQSTSTKPSNTTAAPITNAKEAFQYLSKENSSYTIDTTTQSTSDERIGVYTANYVQFETNDGDISGYLKEKEGVAQFDYVDEQLVRSELLKDSSGKNYTKVSEVVSTFSSFDGSSLTLDSNEFNVTGKKPTLDLLGIFNIPKSSYLNISSFTGTFSIENGQPKLTFNVDLKNSSSQPAGENYSVTISSFDSSSVDYLEDYEANPGEPYAPSEDEVAIRTLFKGNNFTQYRDIDTTVEGYDSMDYFTERYYFLGFSDAFIHSSTENEGIAAQYSQGGLAIANKTIGSLYYNGIYLFYINNGQFQLITQPSSTDPTYATPYFNSDTTDVVAAWNYPSNLKIFNNFQYFTAEDGKLETTKKELLDDFVSNFNLSEENSSYGGASSLEILYDLTPNQEEITMNLHYNGGVYSEYVFKDFGTTELAQVEDFIDQNKL